MHIIATFCRLPFVSICQKATILKRSTECALTMATFKALHLGGCKPWNQKALEPSEVPFHDHYPYWIFKGEN
jgi:hypothetical protein